HERSVSLVVPTDEGIWVGIGNRLVLLEPEHGRLVRSVTISTNQSGPVTLRGGVSASDGVFWVAATKGLFRIGLGNDVAVAVAAQQTGSASALIKGTNGRLYAACAEGLFEITGEDSVRQLWTSPSSTVTALAEILPGLVWFASARNGLMQIELESAAVSSVASGGTAPGALPDSLIYKMSLDRSGLLWLATLGDGLYTVDPAGTRFATLQDPDTASEATGRNNVVGLFSTSGALWMGTMGDGLKRYEWASGTWSRYRGEVLRAFGIANPQRPVIVRSIADAGEGQLWFASQFGIAMLDPASGIVEPLPPLPDGDNAGAGTDSGPLLVTRDGSLWAGNRGNRIARFDNASRQWQSIELVPGADQANLTLSLFEGAAGTIWAGSLKGLHRVDTASGSVRTFSHVAGNARSLTSSIVRSIYQGEDGVTWIGTQAGLNRLDSIDADGAQFTSWPESNELRDDTIYAILAGPLNRLWASTNRGLIAVDRKSGSILDSSIRDGLQALEFNGGSVAQIGGGSMAFGGPNGVNYFQPLSVNSSTFSAPVQITEVRIGNREPIQPLRQAKIDLDGDVNLVTLGFAALDYAAPHHNRFQYRLKGFDDEWVDGFRPVAAFSHLQPGDYTFQVRGSNRDGVFGDQPAELSIVVPVPWWMSGEAKLAYLVGGLLVLLLALNTVQRRRGELLRRNAELMERENRLHMAVWGSGDQFWDWDLRRGMLVRTKSEPTSGSSVVVEIPIDVWQAEVHPDDIDALRQRMIDHVEHRTDIYESEHRLRDGDDWRWVLARGRVVERDRTGAATRISGTSRDITLTRLAEQDRRIAIQVLQDMEEAVSVFDLDFHFVSVNPAFSRVTCWPDNEVIGKSTGILDSPQQSSHDYARVRRMLVNDGSWNGELWQRRSDGSDFASWTQLNEVRDARGLRTHYVGVFTDITERKRSEQELRYLANYDTLTGLPNRTLLAQRLSAVLAEQPVKPGAVLYLDLDHFKHVNDSYGHAAGDRLLRAAGDRLRQIIDIDDTVARLGGDEFAIILHTISSEDQAAAVARRVIKAFALPIEIGDGETVTVTTSIGISLFPEHGDKVAELLKFADTAMYQAKSSGRNTFMVYTEDMNTQARHRASVIAALRKAIARNEFRLVFQPRLSLSSNRMSGVEALLRWNSADLGEIGPAQFIPYAEETGLILPIGDWVLRETCAQMARWRSAGLRGLTASINVSMLQLQRGNVAGQLAALLDEFAIPADQIEVELTESVVMANAELSIGILQKLRDVGVTVSIDDFGTGYSSLSYLKRLPIDTLKIDKAFVGDITTDMDDRAITATIIAMARSLGLNVVAEGVETAAQVEFLREHGCDEIQGYWLSRPLPPDECLAFLQERMQRRSPMLGT
ncbi:MAG: EAL domain-containing protein, partial [Dokdonella sp.]